MNCLSIGISSCMESGMGSYIWIASGIVMIILEFFIPGVFIVFLGTGAVITGLFLQFIPVGFNSQFGVWVLASLGCILLLGHFFRQLFPSREVYDSKKIDSIDGQIVEVTHKIINGKKSGRVLLNGTEWNATTSGHEIERGEYVKILTRNNLTLVVEKVSHSELEKFLNANKKPSEDDYP